MISGRLFGRGLLVLLAAVWIIFMLYAFRVEPYWLDIERTEFEFAGRRPVPNGLRIVHLSDIHRSAAVPDSYISDCVSRAMTLRPDIVLLTGDYITGGEGRAVGVGELLAPLEAPLGVWASLGNHDGGAWSAGYGGPEQVSAVRRELEGAGIGVLGNESVLLHHAGVPLRVVGLGDLWAGFYDPGKAFRGAGADEFVICLTHNPDTINLLGEYPVDLFLCGHTHGGQVRLPFVGAPLLPVKDTRFSAGPYRIGDSRAYVSRGVGSLKGVRFNCRPEISLIVVR